MPRLIIHGQCRPISARFIEASIKHSCCDAGTHGMAGHEDTGKDAICLMESPMRLWSRELPGCH